MSLAALELKMILQKNGFDTRALQHFANFRSKEVYLLKSDGTPPGSRWHRLRTLVDLTGYWPVLLPDPQLLEEVLPMWQGLSELDPAGEDDWSSTPERIVQRGLLLDAVELMHRDAPSLEALEADDNLITGSYDPLTGMQFGLWPEEKITDDEIWLFLSHGGEEAHIVLFPTRSGWEVPALLYFGGTNNCPCPSEQVYWLKRFHDKYASELVFVDHNAVGLWSQRLIADRETATIAAQELCTYCSDFREIVGNLHWVATGWMQGRFWYITWH